MRWLLLALALTLMPDVAQAARVKDLGAFYGVRDNQLTGAGLIVGLGRTGDSTRNAASIQALASRLQGLGVSLDPDDILSRNVAMVMVSGTMHADHRTGSRIDVTVASTGDATSLEGGMLLMTPLFAPDGKIYASAEGSVVVGGWFAEAEGTSSRKNSPTVGRVVGGAMVERELASAIDYDEQTTAEFVLRSPDFTTALRVAEAVNAAFGAPVAHPSTSSTIEIDLPTEYQGQFARFASELEAIDLTVDAPARVVVNERTGTVVMGADVRIAPVAVAHGGLTIEVKRQPEVSQPGALAMRGQTVTTAMATVDAREEDGSLVLVEGVSIGDLVAALNSMGVKPRDLMVILQAIKTSGSLHAELVAI